MCRWAVGFMANEGKLSEGSNQSSTAEEAEEAYKRITEGGESFVAVAADVSLDGKSRDKGGELYPFVYSSTSSAQWSSCSR